MVSIIAFMYLTCNKLEKRIKSIELFNADTDVEDVDTIPKIIIQTWKDLSIPSKYIGLINSVKKTNPSYNYLFFTDNDIEVFLKKYYPIYYETFQKLPIIIQKIDFFRYIAVYHYGGFYLDLDIECLKSFDPLLKYDSVFGIDKHITILNRYTSQVIQQISQDNSRTFLVGQYAFGARKKNDFIKLLIDGIHNNISSILQKYEELKNKKNLDFVYNTTGPNYVSDVYYTNINKNNKVVTILEYDMGQYFGDYARHKFMGTWKEIKH